MYCISGITSAAGKRIASSGRFLLACLSAWMISFLPLAAGADAGTGLQLIEIDSGERLLGEVLPQSTDSMLHIRSGLLGEVALLRSRVVRMEAVSPGEASPGPVAEAKPLQAPPHPPAKKPSPSVAASPEKSPTAPVKKPLPSKKVESPLVSEIPAELGLFDYLTGLRAPDSWSGNFRMGMNISTGDSLWTQTYLRGKLEVRPKGKSSLYRLAGSYLYQENERANGRKIRSQDKYDASFLYRYGFKNKWFVQNALSLRADQKKGIDRDLSDLLGIGYGFRPFEKVEFNVGGAGGVADYQSNKASSRNGRESTLSVFEELVWKPLKRTSLIHRFNYYWNPEDNNQYNYVLKTALRVRVTDLLGFEFSFNKDYDNDTGTGNNKNDTRWLNALILFF